MNTNDEIDKVVEEIFNLPASANDQEDSVTIAKWHLAKLAEVENAHRTSIQTYGNKLAELMYENMRLKESLNEHDFSVVEKNNALNDLKSQNLRMRQALEWIKKEFPTIKISRLSGVTDDLHETIEEALKTP